VATWGVKKEADSGDLRGENGGLKRSIGTEVESRFLEYMYSIARLAGGGNHKKEPVAPRAAAGRKRRKLVMAAARGARRDAEKKVRRERAAK